MKLFVGLGNPGSELRAPPPQRRLHGARSHRRAARARALEEALPRPRLRRADRRPARAAAEAADLHERQRPVRRRGAALPQDRRGRHLSSSTTRSTWRPASSRSRPAAATPATTACARSRRTSATNTRACASASAIRAPRSWCSGYVLHDFAKADAAWLEPLLDAIADAARRLAAGDDARFLTDVARAAAGDGKAQAREQRRCRARAARTGCSAAPAPRAHPAGERQSKRGSALAENLKRWLHGAASRES